MGGVLDRLGELGVRIASHGSPERLAMFVSMAKLAFDSGAIVYFFLRRVSSGMLSGDGFSRCQTRFHCLFRFR